jgi:MFS family permease
VRSIGSVAILLVSLLVAPWTLLCTSFVVGLTFAWKKVPVDTMVQEAVPDGLRGRVFAAYDVVYNVARLAAALLAVPLLPAVGEQGAAAIVGIAFLLWVPVLPRWLARAPEIRLRFTEGGRAEEWPLAVIWGGVEEPVEVVRSALDERDGVLVRRFRLALADGTVLDVAREEPDGEWRIERELV